MDAEERLKKEKEKIREEFQDEFLRQWMPKTYAEGK